MNPLIELAITYLISTVKNDKHKEELKDALVPLRDALNLAYPPDTPPVV
jgi:hypothetical protein